MIPPQRFTIGTLLAISSILLSLSIWPEIGCTTRPSFPRKRESRALGARCGLDPRYGYTGVVANSLTRGGIFDGLKAEHTYAVFSPYGVGKRILLKASSGDFIMGDAFRTGSNPLRIKLQGKTDLVGFRAVSLVVNGVIAGERLVSGNEISEEFDVSLPRGDNYTFFAVQAENPNDPRIQESLHKRSTAFTSPMFITAER